MPRDQRRRIEKLEQRGKRPEASGMEAIILAASVIRAGGVMPASLAALFTPGQVCRMADLQEAE